MKTIDPKLNIENSEDAILIAIQILALKLEDLDDYDLRLVARVSHLWSSENEWAEFEWQTDLDLITLAISRSRFSVIKLSQIAVNVFNLAKSAYIAEKTDPAKYFFVRGKVNDQKYVVITEYETRDALLSVIRTVRGKGDA